MPGKLKVRVVSGRSLPIMDRSTDLTDAFVEVRFGNEAFKTDVCKRSLNPQWASEWFKFEVEDESLQDDPLELRVLDHDTYSAHDAIGKVYIDLNPLLTKDNPHIISGWFPIYDTMHGIRGELNVIVKVDLFSDFNKFRQSSCGVQFFSTAEVPCGYRLQMIHGFVEELVVNDDPEYQWIDKIRTPRASNEARQRLFSRLSGELQRKIGLKVLELSGNSVIGYTQCFDLEGESGIVVRSIGTAVTINRPDLKPVPSPLGVSPQPKDLRHAVYSSVSRSLTFHHIGTPPLTPVKQSPLSSPPPSAPPLYNGGQSAFSFHFSSPVPEDAVVPSSPPSQVHQSMTSPVKVSPLLPQRRRRRSSDSDISNTPPKGNNSLTESSGSGSAFGSGGKVIPKLSAQQPSIEMMEYPFFTMTSFPPGFIVHLGGVVSARSVKLLDRIHNPEEPETRDAWWTEIRTEIRSHARAMGCHAVLGYSEHTSICDEVIVLSAMGTAARVTVTSDLTQLLRHTSQPVVPPHERPQIDKDKRLFVDVNLANQVSQNKTFHGGFGFLYSRFDDSIQSNCSLCHIPYKASSTPFPVKLALCAICKKKKVPDVLFTTVDPPSEIQICGRGSLIQARICRVKLKGKGETNAREISDSLPFLEYELHNQLMNKLKLRGMNGLFGLKIQISVGDTLLVGIATATAVFLTALLLPPIPKVTGQATSERENLALIDLQKKIIETVQKNREIHDLVHIDTGQTSPHSVTTDESDDDVSDLELSSGNKNTFILEVDDTKDHNIASILKDSATPEGFNLLNTERVPGSLSANLTYNFQMFNYVWRHEFIPSVDDKKQDFSDLFENIKKKICFKLRRMVPCCVCKLDFNVQLPDEDEIQITLTGVCVGLTDQHLFTSSLSDIHASGTKGNLLKTAPGAGDSSGGGEAQPDDMMFQMEELSESSPNLHNYLKASRTSKDNIQISGSRRCIHPYIPKHKVGIEITPLAYVPGGKIERYLGNYNFFFIRETTSLREMGGDGGFMQTFIAEVLANVRASVAALGGNGLVAYRMSQCVLLSNPQKNQSQCLINVYGDAVCICYDGEPSCGSALIEHTGKTMDSPVIIHT
ncbi:C2 domain-containing protein 5-like isoform X2 [Mizuhopecten yessoensis]|uniref:C2 domain-containing protein 5-like isoform X2 n=1 Tax=Mizuhopecten yessoensis TaxID=6573 RepID=UPI000B45B802|nr:C2 domain-containing protein 5-like isoform X2 [Mizuhopecten yessoensis]